VSPPACVQPLRSSVNRVCSPSTNTITTAAAIVLFATVVLEGKPFFFFAHRKINGRPSRHCGTLLQAMGSGSAGGAVERG